MKRFRSVIAGLLALLLIFPNLGLPGGGNSVYADGLGGTGAAQIPAGTVLIKNKWKSNFLYETSEGVVRYGMTNPADTSSHWSVVTEGGLSRIQNVKTGHFITLEGNAGKEDSLKAAAATGGGSTADQWLIDTSNRAGYMVIRSATAQESKLVIHEENQLGYAQASADINITFESPQWAFVSLNAAPVRIESVMRPGNVMFENEGKVQHGAQPLSNEAAQWFLEPGTDSGTLLIRNRATGHYIKQNEEHWYGVFSAEIDPAKANLSEWVQEPAPGTPEAGLVTFRNQGLTDGGNALWLNPQYDGDSDVRSNNWPGWGGNPSAQWRIVTVSELQPVRITTYTDAQVATDFLYEAAGGELQHGVIAPDAADESQYLWYAEDYDGHKRIRNAATGHYLNYADGAAAAVTMNSSLPSDQWDFNESDDYDDYQTIENVGTPGNYLSLLGGGHAGAGSDASSLSAQWQLLDPDVPTDGSLHYYRIQNTWQSFYWYESSDGVLKYGNMQEDGSDQWLIEKYNGRKLFQNKKTGHYMNVAQMPDGHISVAPLDGKDNVDPAYIWTGRNTGDSTYVIASVLDKEPNKRPLKYISLQNLTKYAEYGVINPDWGSPKWKFVPVTEKKHDLFRFKLDGVNGADQYLKDDAVPAPVLKVTLPVNDGTVTADVYDPQDQAGGDLEDIAEKAAKEEEALLAPDAGDTATAGAGGGGGAADPTVGQATYGELIPGDDSFVWQLIDIPGSNGAVKIKNRGTGRFISLESLGAVIEQEEPSAAVRTEQTVYDVWASIRWIVDMQESGRTTFKSAWAGHYLYGAADDNGYPVIRISKAADAAVRDSAQFTAEPVYEPVPPLPVAPVRFKNAGTGDYLYENEHGVVLYGQPALDNGYSHWSIVTDAGQQYIVNRATGHYITLNSDYSFLESTGGDPADTGASAWDVSLAADAKHYTIRSLYGEYNDEYINLQNKTGYAERALLLDTEASLQWTLEAAPQEFNMPEGEAGNTDTATPVQNDTNIITIAPQGMDGTIVAEKDGKLVYADASGGPAQAQWLVQDFNGRNRVMNVQTGHYLARDQEGAVVLVDSGDKEDSQWNIKDKLGYRLLLSADKQSALAHGEAGVQLGAVEAQDALWSFIPVAQDAVYAGQEAFHGDGVLRFAVNADVAGEYDVVLRYRNASAAAAELETLVNGLKQGDVSLAARASASVWQTAELTLDLRTGINTVSFSGAEASLSGMTIDSLTVKDSINKTYRGATLPYISYEAEDAVTNGTQVTPSRKYRSLASEASGREAVILKNTGEYVEFTLAKPANSIVLRYSIPDSPDGAGAEETLSLFVNGERRVLNLTSKYAWEYGSYPWSNDPRQGSGHRFYDEIHALIGEAPAGAVIRLEKGAEDTAASYVIDLVDMEQVAPALAQPEGFLSVTDFGAIAGDDGDDTAAFKAALAAADAQDAGVWFPEGSFNVGSGLLDLDDAEIRGAGMWYTTLNGAKFYGHGGKTGVYDLLIEGGINVRDDEAVTNAFHGAFGQGSVIQNVWIEHTKAGLWLTQPKDEKARTNGLYMAGLRIRNLMADGINFAVGTGNSMMEQSDIRYPGDDGIAMWSFTDAGLNDVNGSERTPSFNNTVRFNNVSLPWLADNIVVFGGKDNKIQDNIVKDTVTNGAGIAVSTRFSAEPFQGTTVVERNTLLRTGSYDSGYGVNLGAIWLYTGENNINSNVLIRNNIALDSTYSGLIVHGNLNMDGITLTDNVIDGAGTNGVEITKEMRGSLLADNLIIRGERMNLVANTSSTFTVLEKNQGIASSVKPFSIKLGDGQTGPVVLKEGTSSKLQVLDQKGTDITAQAVISIAGSSLATVEEGKLQAVAKGNTTFTVSALGSTRVYDLVISAADPVDPVDPGTPSPSPTAAPSPTPSPTAAPSPNANPNPQATPTATPAPVIVPAANNDAQLKSIAAGQKVIEVAADAEGTARFSGTALRAAAAASPDAVLVVRSGDASYRLPLSLADSVLKGAKLPDGTLEFKLAPQTGAELAGLLAAAGKQNYKVKGTPAGFTLNVTDGKTSLPAGSFGTVHVERTFTINEVMDVKTAVALVYNAKDGTFRYVPAVFESGAGVTRVTVKSSLAGGIMAVAVNPASFGDIYAHWAKDEINLLASRLIVNGQSAGVFAPQRTVSRAEFASMLVRSLGLQPDAPPAAAVAFRDVPASSWYAADAETAVLLGLVQGYADGSFRPDAMITREQMAVMAARAWKLLHANAAINEAASASALPGPGTFKDAASISAWAKEAVGTLTATGIMNGQSAGYFAPDSNTSRAETAVILTRLLRAGKLLNE
ncbi:S-layer homology domain-containing protein [Paenibacillus phytohabitans]|uniref:S-layer homology domain-containing protein n=1 Tax=Paenibacillus phytohabitans TaxID=2654978 RepID=UPI0030081683